MEPLKADRALQAAVDHGPSKGELIVHCLLDALGPAPLEGTSRAALMSSTIRWIAGKLGEPGVGDAFAGVFSDALSDPALREILSARLQDPYRFALQDALGEPENRVLFVIDVVVGVLLHSPQCTVTDAVVADPSVQPWRWAVTFTVIFWSLPDFTRTYVGLVAPVMALPSRFQE